MGSSIPWLLILGNTLITRITASFDRQTNKHQIDVTFSESFARLLARPTGDLRSSADDGDPSGNDSAVLCVSGVDVSEDYVAKKSQGSRINSAADHAYSVTVE